jgi:hypothetical protein
MKCEISEKRSGSLFSPFKLHTSPFLIAHPTRGTEAPLYLEFDFWFMPTGRRPNLKVFIILIYQFDIETTPPYQNFRTIPVFL